MPTISQTTTATREQYSAGLTDFGPGRSKLCGTSADADLILGVVLGTVGKRILA